MVKKVEQTKVVLYPNIARKLLKMGYRIIDLKPKKENAKGTLFVFAVEGNFTKDFSDLMAEMQTSTDRKIKKV